MEQTRHFLVTGRVQGVFFRASTREQALKLGVNGWVRNLPDGEVEVEATGSPTQLDALAEWLQQGPPEACVKQIQTNTYDAAVKYGTFEVRY